MKTIKNSQLFAVSLILGIALCLPISFAKAMATPYVNSANVETTSVKAENVETTNIKEVRVEPISAHDNQINTSVNRASTTMIESSVGAVEGRVITTENRLSTSTSENKASTSEGQNNDNQFNGAKYQGTVTTVIKSLLNVANKNIGGIGGQIRIIANEQNGSSDNVANAIDKIKNRSTLKTFLIGADYKNVGQLRSAMVKTGNQIDKLNKLSDQAINTDDKAVLQAQVQVLTQEQQNINDFLNANQEKFSLFGWFVKLFNK